VRLGWQDAADLIVAFSSLSVFFVQFRDWTFTTPFFRL
jgi:hypothetical protein